MFSDPIAYALTTPGHVQFPSTRALVEQFLETGGQVDTRPTGHRIFYRADGRRVLATDPAGHPLHECEWVTDTGGIVRLARARVRLDWGRWVGILPCGLVNETRLNLTGKPNWRQITPDDLRMLAAGALRVPIEEVRWFYRDEDLTIDAKGIATIRHRKDALYVLQKGGFEQAQFMSCMGAMHWESIDFLPVVELFKSLLPGTGSAIFELIRGLYDDQQREQPIPRPLRYRGIPVYPSEAAFRLFSSCFTPRVSDGTSPHTAFMNPSTAHRVMWLPAQHPPVRYLDPEQGACLTIQNDTLQKVTLAEDLAGLSYMKTVGGRVAPCDRRFSIHDRQVILYDREMRTVIDLKPGVSLQPCDDDDRPMSPVDWRAAFIQGPPAVQVQEAFESVLLYPSNEDEISELATQPFVADYLQDLGGQDREIGRLLSQARRVLIANGDAVVASCVPFDQPREYTVSCHHAAYAQRQAQQLWTQCAEVQQWEWLKKIRIVPVERWEQTISDHLPYDVIYQWCPYESFDTISELRAIVTGLRQVLRPGGTVFITGPATLQDILIQEGLNVYWNEAVASLPTFRMHQTILPKARLKPGLTLFHAAKR